MIPLSEAIRISKNKANFNLRFGRPEDGDYTGAEAFLQAESNQAAAPAVARSSGPGSSPGSMPPATTFPGGILSARREASNRLFGPPTLPGMVPAGIKAANPEAYFDERSGGTVIGASGRNRNAIGGPTWSGNAMKNGAVMQNTNMASFGMPAPNERRGTIGGGGGGAPDMFGRNFGGGGKAAGGPDPFAAAPDLNPSSPYYDASAAQKSRENAFAPGSRPRGRFADGGLVPNPGGLWHGPGGPKDDEIHAKVSPGEFEMPFEAVMFHGTKKLRTMIDEARESGDTMPSMPKSKGRAAPPMMMPGFADGGYVQNPFERAMADQDVAAEANYISPGALVPTASPHANFNPHGGANAGWEPEGMGHFLFPQPGIDASSKAGDSTRKAITAFDQFMAQQPAFDAAVDARTADRRAKMELLNHPAYVAKLAAEAPNPYRTAPAMTGGVDTGMAYAPNMNDHPAFNEPDPQTLADMRARRSAIRAQDAPPAMFTPTLEPQAPVPTFAPRMVGAPNPKPQSQTPFMAPWEKDAARAAAARAAAADAASGRPEGVRKSDWRRMQADPKFILAQQARQDKQAAAAQRERVRLDEQAVAVNRDLFRTNTGIQMDAINRAASTQSAADARAVEENYRMAAENRKIGNEAAMRAAENNMPPQDIPGTDYVRTAYGNLPKTRPNPEAPPGMALKSLTVGGARYEVPEGDKPSGPLKIRAKLQPKDGFEMVQWSDGMILPSPRNISPTDKQKEDAYKAVTGQEIDKASPEHWSDAYYFARGERPPRWTHGKTSETAAAPNEKAASLRSKYGY